ncbi:MAG: four helix bundle protein [Alphaproteobacteria bacterium]|nr:four helix bundle protein [Alphaproteobacteria bacterium]
MSNRIINQKSELFSDRIVNLYKYVYYTKKETVMSKQILKSGTSVGANLTEAECASSRKDFINKNYIAYKEINETMYWLRRLKSDNFLTEKQFNSIYTDAEEIKKILTAILKTLKNE